MLIFAAISAYIKKEAYSFSFSHTAANEIDQAKALSSGKQLPLYWLLAAASSAAPSTPHSPCGSLPHGSGGAVSMPAISLGHKGRSLLPEPDPNAWGSACSSRC